LKTRRTRRSGLALKGARDRAREELVPEAVKVLSELEYSRLALKYGEILKPGPAPRP